MSWMATIMKDAGIVDPYESEGSSDFSAYADAAIEQIKNASPRQILDYMNERSEAINE